jgi:hypothetical protein
LVLVVIGPDWLTTTDAQGRPRLQDAHDFVRVEIATALQRGTPVVPVLVCGARMPSQRELPEDIAALARRQAHELSDSRWDYDIGVLIATLEGLGIESLAQPPVQPRGRRVPWRVLGPVAGVLLIGVLLTRSARLGAWREGAASSDTAATELTVGVASVEEELAAVLRGAAQARTVAEEAVDPRVLEQYYSGIALQFMGGKVQALAVQGRFAVNTLHAQEIRSYQITPDGQYATLAVEESWSTRRFDARTRECVHALPQHRIAQKVLLMRSATQSWRIYSLELEPGIEPVELACP